MAKKTEIKKDIHGLYVDIEGGTQIGRPFWGTSFKEGDLVKVHHFGGSTKVGVSFRDPLLKFNSKEEDFEYWYILAPTNPEDINKPINTRPFGVGIMDFWILPHNAKFKEKFKSRFS